jgi:flavin reductase (DIM6/NTAB) family NADH-FMN oxidoreductase RutF
MIAGHDFRRTMGLFTSGVSVIAAESASGIRAMTANAVSSVSLDPALVLFCPAKTSQLAASLRDRQNFTINFLRRDQEALATYFAGAWKDSHAPPFRFLESGGAPRLEGSLASLECATSDIVEGGDHWIVVGLVRSSHRGVEPHRPLLFFKGQFHGLGEESGTPAPGLGLTMVEPACLFYDGWHV